MTRYFICRHTNARNPTFLVHATAFHHGSWQYTARTAQEILRWPLVPGAICFAERLSREGGRCLLGSDFIEVNRDQIAVLLREVLDPTTSFEDTLGSVMRRLYPTITYDELRAPFAPGPMEPPPKADHRIGAPKHKLP